MSGLNTMGALKLQVLATAPPATLGGGAINDNFNKLANAVGDQTLWSSTTTYSINDTVLYGTTNYICIVTSTTQPPSDATDWSPIGSAYLPLSGGTLTGQLNGTSARFSNSGAAGDLKVSGVGTDTYQYADVGLVQNGGYQGWFLSYRAYPAEQFQIYYSNGVGGYVQKFAISSGGNTMIGTISDDGVHQLQVAGSVCISGTLTLPSSSTPPTGSSSVTDAGSGTAAYVNTRYGTGAAGTGYTVADLVSLLRTAGIIM